MFWLMDARYCGFLLRNYLKSSNDVLCGSATSPYKKLKNYPKIGSPICQYLINFILTCPSPLALKDR